MIFSAARKRIFLFASAMVLATSFGLSQVSIAQAAPMQPETTVDQATLLRPGELKDMTEGQANAPVTIIEYASLTCSHCADFGLETMPEIREKYIKTGKVHFIMRELALEARSAAASMLTRCVPEDRFFPFVTLLYEKQKDWAFVQDSKTPLMRFAKMAGLDEKEFNACLTNQDMLDKFTKSTKQAVEGLGINVTPTLFINGQKYTGALSADDISAIVDKILAEKEANK